MTKQFFITGLPRSRTAWMANLLTWGDSMCYHDPVDLVGKYQGDFAASVVHRLQCASGAVGISDSSNLYAWREFHHAFPEAKWVVIDRSPYQVIESCSKIIPSFDGELIWDLNREVDQLRQALCPLVVPFEMNHERCMAVSAYLGIDIGPATRVRQLCDMNIQIHPPILKRRLAQLKSQLVVDSKEAA